MHEQQIRMIMRPRDAYDLDGRRTRDVDIVQTRGGTATHLAFFGSAGKLTFCGNPVAGPSPAWFQLNGCKKCAKSASKHTSAGSPTLMGHAWNCQVSRQLRASNVLKTHDGSLSVRFSR